MLLPARGSRAGGWPRIRPGPPKAAEGTGGTGGAEGTGGGGGGGRECRPHPSES
jgi:hypothetical protein